ncbi:hypothetical protein C0991_011021 [Blastosporella zonata]|nr:hypothetical protein C0991_011021 [Blastosporella zonata]
MTIGCWRWESRIGRIAQFLQGLRGRFPEVVVDVLWQVQGMIGGQDEPHGMHVSFERGWVDGGGGGLRIGRGRGSARMAKRRREKERQRERTTSKLKFNDQSPLLDGAEFSSHDADHEHQQHTLNSAHPQPDPDPTNRDTIRCKCRSIFDDGFSIACNICLRWCHAACFGILQGEVPDEWKCWLCTSVAPLLQFFELVHVYFDKELVILLFPFVQTLVDMRA